MRIQFVQGAAFQTILAAPTPDDQSSRVGTGTEATGRTAGAGLLGGVTESTSTNYFPNPPQRLIRDNGRDRGRQRLRLPVHDEENLVVAVEVGFDHGDGGAGDAENRRPQPLPYYLTTPPSDKPKFAGADVPLEAPLDPLEAGGVLDTLLDKMLAVGWKTRETSSICGALRVASGVVSR